MRTLLSSCALFLLSGSAAAQLLVPVTQDRSISGTGDIFGPETISDSDSDQALDFLQFDSGAAVTVDNGFALGSGGGTQDSELLDASVIASGSAFANGESYDFEWEGSASGRSTMRYDFTLTAKAAYTISGEIAAFDNGDTIMDLSNNTTSFENDFAFGPSDIVVINAAGILEPGDYKFVVESTASAYGSGFNFDYGFAEYDLTLQFTPLSANYCVAAANSVGSGAILALGGSQNISDNDFRIEATGAIPGGFGLVFYGPNQIQSPFGDGFRCVGGLTHRVQPPVQANPTGDVSKPISFTSGPAASGSGQINASSAWNFQLWYRDTMAPGGTGFNVSDGLSVTFCP